MKNVRIQFETSEASIEEIESLMIDCSIRTKKELFNNALTLLEWTMKEKKAGRIIASISESGEHKELVMPWMSNVRSNKQGR